MKMISVTTCSQFSSPADMPASRRTVSKVRRTRSLPVTPGQQGLSLATFLRFLHIRPTARNVASPEPATWVSSHRAAPRARRFQSPRWTNCPTRPRCNDDGERASRGATARRWYVMEQACEELWGQSVVNR